MSFGNELGNELTFYFNSSPSQLDPNFTPVTTLTEKGRQYSRQAGSGIALIEVNLLYGDSTECDILVGARSNMEAYSKSDVSLALVTPNEPGNKEQFKVRVEITNTTVDIDIIHKVSHCSTPIIFLVDSHDCIMPLVG